MDSLRHGSADTGAAVTPAAHCYNGVVAILTAGILF